MCVCVSSSSRESERVCVKQRWRKTLFFVCDWLCCKKLSVETLNPNSVGAHFEGAFFWPKWWKALALASIRAAKLEREFDPLILSLNEKKVSVLCAFFLSLSSFTSETTGGVRLEWERVRDPERESKRERILCSIFFDRKGIGGEREFASLLVQKQCWKNWKKRENQRGEI